MHIHMHMHIYIYVYIHVFVYIYIYSYIHRAVYKYVLLNSRPCSFNLMAYHSVTVF